ncbi:MAG: TerB family tellurite resistance protein [Rhizobiaceae bacterium]
MARGLLGLIGRLLEGDPGVRKVADDPVLTAELLLLFRMILADGVATEAELKTFRRICIDSFGIPERSIERVIGYLNDFGYETRGEQAVNMFSDLPPERRRLLARHMAEIAKADEELAGAEVRLLGRTLAMLGLKPEDTLGSTA